MTIKFLFLIDKLKLLFLQIITHLAMKAAATVLIFLCLINAATVSEFPTTPTTIIINVMTPAAVSKGLEYLKKIKKIVGHYEMSSSLNRHLQHYSGSLIIKKDVGFNCRSTFDDVLIEFSCGY